MAGILLNSIENINSALAAVKNNKNIRPAAFYDKILLDTIKVPMEDYVHLQYATDNKTVPAGYQTLELTRLGTWMPHTEFLPEGMPPRPDLTKSETIKIGYTQFGRFTFFTDQIRTDIIVDMVTHYSKEMADLANRTIEMFAREKLLSSTQRYFANGKTRTGQLLPGDVITIADLRLLTAKLERNFIGTRNGFYNYICSPEFMYDLIDDPYVKSYMELNDSTFKMYSEGQPMPLFKIKYVSTRLDENIAPDLYHPGAYIASDGKQMLRMATRSGDVVFSVVNEYTGAAVNNEKDVTDTTKLAQRVILKKYYYKDGSAIENRVYWKINPAVATTASNVVDVYKLNAEGVYEQGTFSDVTEAVLTEAVELPINRGILTGAKGLIKLMVEGQGTAQIIVKGLGSAGTSDPLDQLSSIGFKLRGLGFGIERPEAIFVTLSVPVHALELSGISSEAILGNPDSFIEEIGNITSVSGVDTYAKDSTAVKNPEDLGLNKKGDADYKPEINDKDGKPLEKNNLNKKEPK